MAIIVLLLSQTAASLSFSQIQELPPQAAGDAVLLGQQHGPVEMFEAPTGGMLPPGMIEGQLVERPTMFGSVCVRKVWTVLFNAASKADIGTAKVESIHGTQEIMLASSGICPSGRYAHLNPGVDLDQGRDALERLRDVSAPTSRTHFQCLDKTSSKLCLGDKADAATLRTLKPWAVTESASDILIWLGVAGNAVTEVRFSSGQPSRISVTRSIPPPF